MTLRCSKGSEASNPPDRPTALRRRSWTQAVERAWRKLARVVCKSPKRGESTSSDADQWGGRQRYLWHGLLPIGRRRVTTWTQTCHLNSNSPPAAAMQTYGRFR
jgi:hypothetical protein